MRLLCILLVFLLLAGPVAAISMNPASVQSAVKVTTARPLVTMTVQRTAVAQPIGTEPVSPMLYISSVPSGAAVFADGTARGVTPATIGLYPGTHTIVLSLDGYKDYTTTVTLADGDKKAFEAQLVRALSASAMRQNISAIGTISPGLRLNRTTFQATMTTPVPNTVCLSGEHCLTAADAALYYKPNWGYKVNEICGYAVTDNNQLVPKYCTSGNPSPITSLNCLSGEYCLTTDQADATLAAGWTLEMGGVLCGWGGTEYEPLPQYCMIGTKKMSGLQPGVIQSVAVVNQITRIPVSINTTSTVAPGVTKKPLGGKRQAGVIDSFFGFFSGIFSHPICAQGQTACGGTCVDTLTDSLNCGMCDYTCFDPAVCEGGECVDGYHFPPNPAGDLL